MAVARGKEERGAQLVLQPPVEDDGPRRSVGSERGQVRKGRAEHDRRRADLFAHLGSQGRRRRLVLDDPDLALPRRIDGRALTHGGRSCTPRAEHRATLYHGRR
jgi:hypothetical protein